MCSGDSPLELDLPTFNHPLDSPHELVGAWFLDAMSAGYLTKGTNMTLEEHFADKGCVVTGAASGIGEAISRLLLEAGAVVFMADRDMELLDSAVEQLGALAERAVPADVDVTDQGKVERVIRDCASRHGRLDFLFNNAGLPYTNSFEKATLEDWRRMIDVNLWGVIYGINTAIPIMREQGGGHIVNTGSLAGLIPLPFQSLYCATKYAVVGLSESLRYELAEENIHFSVGCPGDVATRIFGALVEGGHVEVKPPDHAIPAGVAAQTILEGVADQEGIIVLPEKDKENWNLYRTSPEVAEGVIMELFETRRSNFQATGRYV